MHNVAQQVVRRESNPDPLHLVILSSLFNATSHEVVIRFMEARICFGDLGAVGLGVGGRRQGASFRMWSRQR